MKTPPIKKFNTAKTYGGVIDNILDAGYAPFNEDGGITLMTVFKGRERHTRRKKKQDGTRVKLQSYTGCEGAEDKIFIAASLDGAGAKKKCKHISCEVFISK